MSEQVWWYATRAAGLMTWTTATASVVVGLMLSARAIRARTGPWFLDLHRFLGGISVVFLVAHLVTLWADSFVDFGPRELLVPGASEWRTEAIAWGIVGAYLMVAVEVSSLLRSRVGARLWRAIHLLSFAAMVAGTYHAWLAGSDVENPVTWAIAGIGSVLVLGLVSLRLQRKDPDDPGPSGISDNRAILEEMRRRLEDLPIPESTPQPQITTGPDATLPRRAPVADTLPAIDAPPLPTRGSSGTIAFGADPFEAVPPASSEPPLGNWAAPSPADPFARRTPLADDGADLFEDLTGDPFEPLGIPSASEIDGFPELPPLGPPRDLFASAVGDAVPVDLGTSPFASTRPATPAFEPTSATTVSATAVSSFAVSSSAVSTEGPPPLPDAIDPVTGEPDEAAYTQWLKEWLSYAERYGDEAPGDPSRA